MKEKSFLNCLVVYSEAPKSAFKFAYSKSVFVCLLMGFAPVFPVINKASFCTLKGWAD
jgi:hypothetical protein